MTDTLSPEERSKRMSRIRGTNTVPELALRSALHRLGLRFRLHAKDLPGKPDIVLPKHGAVIFVHGCFWHRHPGCRVATMPKSNTKFWREKFSRNVQRDAQQVRSLRAAGWRVFMAWECHLSTPSKAEAEARRLFRRIVGT